MIRDGNSPAGAARRLGVGRAAVSKRLKALNNKWVTPLFSSHRGCRNRTNDTNLRSRWCRRMTKKVRVASNLAIAGPFRSGAASRACACGRNPGGAGESPALLVSFGPERVLFHPWAVGLPPGSPLPAAVAEPGSRRYPRPVHDQRRHPCTPPRNPSISLHLSVRRWAIRQWRGTKLYAP